MLVEVVSGLRPSPAKALPLALPSAALSALETATRALKRSGDSVRICARRDLVPGQILVGLIVDGIYVAVAIDAAEDTSLKLYDLVVRLLFSEAPAPPASVHATAAKALPSAWSRPASRGRGRR